MEEPPDQFPAASMSPARRRDSLHFSRSPWMSPTAMRRSGGGWRVCNGDLGLGAGLALGGERKRPPPTEKSTKVSTKEERRCGSFLQVSFWVSASAIVVVNCYRRSCGKCK